MFHQIARIFFSFIFLYLTTYPLSSLAAQHALVVGINKYDGEYGNIRKQLGGPVNDATLITATLRKIGVDLPPARVLLDKEATRKNVIRAWQQMVARAKPGDTLIFTFAGHGTRIDDQPPLDEQEAQDGLDETLVLHDDQNCLLDDELYELFYQAKQYKILFVVDACHSGGLTKRLIGGKIRATIPSACSVGAFSPPLFTTGRISDKMVIKGQLDLPNLTVISAVNAETELVTEQTFGDKTYGALSFFFAHALLGEADGDGDHQLTRLELEDFLTEKVRDKTSDKQSPLLFPAAQSLKVVVELNTATSSPTPPTSFDLSELQARVENGSPPDGLQRVKWVNDNVFELLFSIQNQEVIKTPTRTRKLENTKVYDSTGQYQITTIPTQNRLAWQRVIDKEILLTALASQFNMSLTPVQIELTPKKKAEEVYKKGERLYFTLTPKDKNAGLNHLTLFNLAGNGELNFLYPLQRKRHRSQISRFPYSLPSLSITPPYGRDTLVVVLCQQSPTRLHQLLTENEFNLPAPQAFIDALQTQRCQIGQHAFYSKQD
jgi:hypothetical protein